MQKYIFTYVTSYYMFNSPQAKERILKAAIQTVSYMQRSPHYNLSWFLNRNTIGDTDWQEIFRVMKAKNMQPRLLYPPRLSFKTEGQIESFPNKLRLKEFITTKPALQEMLKDLL